MLKNNLFVTFFFFFNKVSLVFTLFSINIRLRNVNFSLRNGLWFYLAGDKRDIGETEYKIVDIVGGCGQASYIKYIGSFENFIFHIRFKLHFISKLQWIYFKHSSSEKHSII